MEHDIFCVCVCGFVCVLIFYSVYNNRKKCQVYDTFKKQGIPGPTPIPLLGTTIHAFANVKYCIFIDLILQILLLFSFDKNHPLTSALPLDLHSFI